VKKPMVVRGIGWFAVMVLFLAGSLLMVWNRLPDTGGKLVLFLLLVGVFVFAALVWLVASVFLWGIARHAADQAKAMTAARGPSPVPARDFHLDERSEFEVVTCSRCNGTGKELVKKQRRQMTSPLDLGNTGSDK